MNDDKIKALQDQLETLQAESRATSIESALISQAPTAPKILRDLAKAELSGKQGAPAELVSAFLATEGAQFITSASAAQQAAQQQQRPKLDEMLNDLSSGSAQLKFN